MDWQTAYYVKLYRSQSPDWLALSPLTRGVFDELLLVADKAGRIQLGKAGLPSIAVPLRGTWAELETHVRALLADGCLLEEEGALVIRGFVEAQARAKTPAERKAHQREKEKARSRPAEERHAPSPPTVTDRDGSRDVTPSHAGHDKDQTDQKEKIPPTPQADPSPTIEPDLEAARREDPGSFEPTHQEPPSQRELLRAYVRGVEEATAGTFGRKLTDEDRGQLEYLWERVTDADPSVSASEFLGRLTARVAEWVRAKNTPAERKYQAGWSPKRFADWLQEQNDAADDAPPPGPAGPAWGEPSAEDLARLGSSRGAA